MDACFLIARRIREFRSILDPDPLLTGLGLIHSYITVAVGMWLKSQPFSQITPGLIVQIIPTYCPTVSDERNTPNYKLYVPHFFPLFVDSFQ